MIKKRNTVLVVEDNDINREILCEILGDDYAVCCAENGEVGMQMLRKYASDIDVVLLDLQMPVMNGYEVIEAVVNDQQLKHIPIIVTTSNDSADEEVRCLQLGATDFVKKPYNPRVVRLRVESIIRLRESTATLSEVEIDKLTGAYTYNAFMHYANEWLKSSPDTEFTLAYTDIIGFKELTERLGDRAYDVLKEMIAELKAQLQDNVIVGHYSFDHLLCFYPSVSVGMGEEEKCALYEARIGSASKKLNIVFKVGVCERVDRGYSLQSHLSLVQQALSEALRQYNRVMSFVGPELMEQQQRKNRIEREMENALATGQMEVYFQPKHDAKTNALVGAEALLRWFHPEMGFISPGEFVPIFEQNGFVCEADAFVWRRTCEYQREWMDKGLRVVPVSVNASRLDFLRPDLEKLVSEFMKRVNVSPRLMHVEMTERFFSTMTHDSIEALQHLRQMGVEVELDDFGTGYSSLNSLVELPVDIVKFDMSFVRKLDDPREQMLMQCCVDMVKRFNLKSVAEGVETEDKRQMIADMGVDAIQGYYYSKPLPPDQFEEYLAKYAL